MGSTEVKEELELPDQHQKGPLPGSSMQTCLGLTEA